MSEITIIYPTPLQKKKKTDRILAAREAFEVGTVDVSSLQKELEPFLKILESLDKTTSTFGVDEVKFSTGVTRDSKGKLRFGLFANVLGFGGGETAAEYGRTRSENQLFEITIRRKTQVSNMATT